jgi:hypothetical protein
VIAFRAALPNPTPPCPIFCFLERLLSFRLKGTFQILLQKNCSWDGNLPDGTAHVGSFKDHFRVTHVSKGLAMFIEGTACRIQCGADAKVFKTKTGCFFSTQVGANNVPDSSLPS